MNKCPLRIGIAGENRMLLQTILEKHPASIKELGEMTGRKSSRLSRTLKTMERYGIVSLTRERNQIRPIVNATEFQIEFDLGGIIRYRTGPKPVVTPLDCL